MSLAPSRRWIFLIIAVVLLDQGTKQLVVGLLEPDRPMIILAPGALPSIDFLLSYNKGVSFSFLRLAGDAQRWPLVGLSLLACGILAWWLRRLPPTQPILATGLALIIGGALGNMLDRARIGSVIDFVHLSYRASSFAVFNLADTAITLGAIATVTSLMLEAA
ncbi:signal peptidase II [Bradyrhizobium guangzhouense]|uniref:Lipoprotein signal peptidase n=1 Tax=Bradyrhizobium guangzhouense TaxID=1325095 RepID=A0AAE5X5E1_9BRAD|nr:signal peptidase II [Bradyrhizobium guangzhouense]QAU48929.1 signal peptidase II [Bradyrhizobium guangzhouense]RXH06938.1 signal peptidase II [Bradyrhizobium guangzhouense]